MLRLLLIPLAVLWPSLALAHEFWIEPREWQVTVGGTVEAHLRVGQAMKGGALSYIPNVTRRFEAITPDGPVPTEAMIGDRPAFRAQASSPGLYVIVHVTGDYLLTYDEFDRFKGFVEHKDLDDTLAQHAARGLPDVGFGEQYSRYAKSLVAVGDGAGSDRELGLVTEITALANPYTDDLKDGFPVSLTYQGAPRADEQIEVFDRDGAGELTVFTLRTDAEGHAVVPVTPGHDYMLDAVVMRPLEAAGPQDPVWESLWANLTFHIPAD